MNASRPLYQIVEKTESDEYIYEVWTFDMGGIKTCIDTFTESDWDTIMELYNDLLDEVDMESYELNEFSRFCLRKEMDVVMKKMVVLKYEKILG